MTASLVCVPLSSSRSMNSLLVSASASLKVGCGTCESSEPTNSSLVPSRFRPVEPIRTMLSGLSWRTWLTVYWRIERAASIITPALRSTSSRAPLWSRS